jgi:hypothetical protein
MALPPYPMDLTISWGRLGYFMNLLPMPTGVASVLHESWTNGELIGS